MLLDLFNAVKTAMAGTVSIFEFGAEHLSDEVAPPRIVWVPTSDSFSGSQMRGTTREDARALHLCHAGFEIHLWAGPLAGVAADQGIDGAMALRDAFIRALRSQVGPNYEVVGGRYEGQYNEACGREYVLSIALLIPIAEETPTIATPTSAPQDVALQTS